MPYTDFHYTPTGTGVISGKEVLEQTEDAINDLGGQISGDVQTAIDTANNALNTANTASADAQNAVNTANTAYTAATNAQNTANTAQNTASNALTAAQNAQNDVNALGNRVTTAENNISQNTSDISGLTTRMGSAEGNITTLQNDVITAQGTATSAQNTATLARGQAYVVRYASVAVSDNSTVPYTDLNNIDNIKANDLLLDTNGKLYQISSVDTANETVSVTTPLTQLAVDANVVHKSGDETVDGKKTFSDDITCSSNSGAKSIICKTPLSTYGSTNTVGDNSTLKFLDKNNNSISYIRQRKLTNGNTDISLNISNTDSNNQPIEATLNFVLDSSNDPRLSPGIDNTITLGRPTFRWKSIYSNSYYYGNVEFSTKFVTTDTAQTISGNKIFSSDVNIYNSDTTTYANYLNLKNQRNVRGSTTDTGVQGIQYQDKNGKTLTMLESRVINNGNTGFNIICYNIDDNNQTVSNGVSVIKSPTTTNFVPTTDNAVTCGRPLAKWSDVQTYKINNLEPSSLSLPSGNVNDVIDISSYLTILDGSNVNTYVAPANGWISILMNNCSSVQCYITGLWGHQIFRPSVGSVRFLMPVLKNQTANILVLGGTIGNARFIPCQGNV